MGTYDELYLDRIMHEIEVVANTFANATGQQCIRLCAIDKRENTGALPCPLARTVPCIDQALISLHSSSGVVPTQSVAILN